jgi:hypothetical protein
MSMPSRRRLESAGQSCIQRSSEAGQARHAKILTLQDALIPADSRRFPPIPDRGGDIQSGRSSSDRGCYRNPLGGTTGRIFVVV